MIPSVHIHVKKRRTSDGLVKTFIEMRIHSGNRYLDIAPQHWDKMVTAGNNIVADAIAQREEQIELSRIRWEAENEEASEQP